MPWQALAAAGPAAAFVEEDAVDTQGGRDRYALFPAFGNRMKRWAYVDIGELGWSLYMSAHVRWVGRNDPATRVCVITYPDRTCLYEGLAERVLEVPSGFYSRYSGFPQNGFGLSGVTDSELRTFFEKHLPGGYELARLKVLGVEFPAFRFMGFAYRYFISACFNRVFIRRGAFEAYAARNPVEGGKRILVFPRCRRDKGHSSRNLPRETYERLIRTLCEAYPRHTVTSVGTRGGAYALADVDAQNFSNRVGKTESLQALIDMCADSVAAVGSQSALPKLALLQGVPTFIIGDQERRHVKRENWMGTAAAFYRIRRRGYNRFKDHDDLIERVIGFVREQVDPGA